MEFTNNKRPKDVLIIKDPFNISRFIASGNDGRRQKKGMIRMIATIVIIVVQFSSAISEHK
jgi:hypothetical protein